VARSASPPTDPPLAALPSGVIRVGRPLTIDPPLAEWRNPLATSVGGRPV